MDWLEENYHKAVGILIALICLIFGGKHIFAALNFDKKFPAPEEEHNAATPNDSKDYVKTMETLVRTPRTWEDKSVAVDQGKNKSVPLFKSVPIVAHAERLYDMGDPNEEPLRPPVSNAWLLEHNLNYLSARVLTFDPDGDGYDSSEEWDAKSNPVDDTSHPPYTNKLVFVEMRQRNHVLTFKADNNPDYQVEEQTTAQGKKGGFYKVGDTLAFGRFKIESYDEGEERLNQFGIKSSMSELTIKDLLTDKVFVIILKKPENRPELFAGFDFLLDSEGTFHKKEGEDFALPKNSPNKYKVISVSENEAVIAPVDRLSQTTVLPLGTVPGPDGEEGGEGGFAEPSSN